MARALWLGAVAALLTFAPALAVQVEGNHLILSPEEVANCVKEGGCVLVTKEYLRDALQAERAKGNGRCGSLT